MASPSIDPDFMTRIDDLLGKMVTIQSNRHYRVGDVLLQRGFKWQDSIDHILSLPEFDHTILRKYFLINGYKPLDVPLLKEITQTFIAAQNWEKPDPRELALHVRAGDVIDTNRYLKLNYISLIDNLVKIHEIKKITMVTCFSYSDYFERELWLYSDDKDIQNRSAMRELIGIFLEEFGDSYDIQVVSNKNVDRDFCYLYEAPFFIADLSGFSKVISLIRDQSKVSGNNTKFL